MATGFSRIVNQIGYKRQFTSPNHGRVVIPGLPYTAFDAFEYPQPWSVLNILDSAQTCVGASSPSDDAGSLLSMNKFYDNQRSYSVTTKIDFSLQLYNKTLVKSPIYVDSWVSYMGSTSLVIDSEARTDSVPLASFRHQQLCVDVSTNRPLPLPDWLKENYRKFSSPGQPMRFPPLKRPEMVSRVKKVAIGCVQYSDTDSNFHLNFSGYIKYCINGLFKDMMSQSEPGIPPQPLLVKSAFTWYRNECYMGDSLDIEYWKEETEPNTVYVDMLRGNTSVFQCILEFYEPDKIKSSL